MTFAKVLYAARLYTALVLAAVAVAVLVAGSWRNNESLRRCVKWGVQHDAIAASLSSVSDSLATGNVNEPVSLLKFVGSRGAVHYFAVLRGATGSAVVFQSGGMPAPRILTREDKLVEDIVDAISAEARSSARIRDWMFSLASVQATGCEFYRDGRSSSESGRMVFADQAERPIDRLLDSLRDEMFVAYDPVKGDAWLTVEDTVVGSKFEFDPSDTWFPEWRPKAGNEGSGLAK